MSSHKNSSLKYLGVTKIITNVLYKGNGNIYRYERIYANIKIKDKDIHLGRLTFILK